MKMFDQTYLDRAMELTKTGNQFFWEPKEAWYFAAQREHKTEKYVKTTFEVRPVFFETRLQIWPLNFNITAARFKQPWPNLVMLYHMDMCVWNMAVGKPKDQRGNVIRDGIVKIGFNDFMQEAIIEINGIDPQLCDTLRLNYQMKHPRLASPIRRH